MRARQRWFYLLVSPWLIGLVGLQLVPLAATGALAFTDWQPPLAPGYVGLANFELLLRDERFIHALYNTIVYGVATVVPGLVIGLLLALLLRGEEKPARAAQAAVFMPAILAGVATAYMWGWLFNPRYGLINALLGQFGIDGPAWLRDATWAMPAMVLMGLWNVGVNVVVYVAALGTVSAELRNAAALDGAGPLARFRHVTWPSISPVTFYLAIVNAVAAFQVFTPTYLLTGGGPDDATLTTSLYSYQVAFGAGQLGYGAAMTIVVLALVLLLTAGQFSFLGRRVAYGQAEP